MSPGNLLTRLHVFLHDGFWLIDNKQAEFNTSNPIQWGALRIRELNGPSYFLGR